MEVSRSFQLTDPERHPLQENTLCHVECCRNSNSISAKPAPPPKQKRRTAGPLQTEGNARWVFKKCDPQKHKHVPGTIPSHRRVVFIFGGFLVVLYICSIEAEVQGDLILGGLLQKQTNNRNRAGGGQYTVRIAHPNKMGIRMG